MIKSGSHITTVQLPVKSAGWYTIGGTYHIHVKEQPSEEQIKNIKELLGWEWSDE